MLEVEHCPRCEQVFRKVTRDICPACVRDLDRMYDLIFRFVRKRENREAAIADIEENTGVDQEDIYRIIRAGRLSTKQFPNLGYPCATESCSNLITSGRICSSCLANINQDLNAIQREKERELRKKKEENSRIKTYQTLDDPRNK